MISLIRLHQNLCSCISYMQSKFITIYGSFKANCKLMVVLIIGIQRHRNKLCGTVNMRLMFFTTAERGKCWRQEVMTQNFILEMIWYFFICKNWLSTYVLCIKVSTPQRCSLWITVLDKPINLWKTASRIACICWEPNCVSLQIFLIIFLISFYKSICLNSI